ncbi:MAG: thioredoxin TrxC [Venatoribacter sp.]
MHYTCPNCGAINRIPDDKRNQSGQCGRCQAALFNNHPIELNDQNFQRFIEKNDMPVVVDFWAAWCGPCKMMAPIFSGLAGKMQHQVRFAKVDTEQAQQTSMQMNIRSIPTLILFHRGKEVDRLSGALPEPQLKQWLEQKLAGLE